MKSKIGRRIDTILTRLNEAIITIEAIGAWEERDSDLRELIIPNFVVRISQKTMPRYMEGH